MKTKKNLLFYIILLMLIFLFSGCNKNEDIDDKSFYESVEEMSSYPLNITDKFGNNIVIDKEPERVISFSPELVEIMYAINAGDKLIGKSFYCDYPEEALLVPDLGDLFNLNIEAIIESDPDLLILSSMASGDLVSTLNSQGINVLILDEDNSFNGVYKYIDTLGKVFNKEKEANDLNNRIKADIEEIEDKIKGLEKPSVYFVVSFGEYDSTATGDTFTSELLEKAGVINAAEDGTHWMYSIEQLVEKDPDYVLCSTKFDSKNQLMVAEGYKDLTAIKENRLFEIDEDSFSRQGPRVVDAIRTLAELVHPGAF